MLHDGRLVPISGEILERLEVGDRVFAVGGDRVLHVPKSVDALVRDAIDRASAAFRTLRHVPADSISCFFQEATRSLSARDIREELQQVNAEDVARAHETGRSTARLLLDDKMLDGMVDSMSLWSGHPIDRERELERIDHDGWSVRSIASSLGVVGFVFEGRPNVVVDACGLLVSGNTCVFRIGRDARRTARAILDLVVRPALQQAGLPVDSIVLLESDEHAVGWSLFTQPDLALAVARGSGPAVRDLGEVAKQCGVPASLHGRGGAWMLVGESADAVWLKSVLVNSLDRKVCNTVNVVCLPRSRWTELSPVVIDAVAEAARRRSARARVHLISPVAPEGHGDVDFLNGSDDSLGTEWEWENDPEITIRLVDDMDEAIRLFNLCSPRLVASVITNDSEEFESAWSSLDCPFVGNGFSRWVDGQYAFMRPELGLSNWENGPMLGRGAILSGSDIFAVRYLVDQRDKDVHR